MQSTLIVSTFYVKSYFTYWSNIYKFCKTLLENLFVTFTKFNQFSHLQQNSFCLAFGSLDDQILFDQKYKFCHILHKNPFLSKLHFLGWKVMTKRYVYFIFQTSCLCFISSYMVLIILLSKNHQTQTTNNSSKAFTY